jgi:hypothetical protein
MSVPLLSLELAFTSFERLKVTFAELSVHFSPHVERDSIALLNGLYADSAALDRVCI